MPAHALVQILPGFAFKPILQTPRRMLGASGNLDDRQHQLTFASIGRVNAHDTLVSSWRDKAQPMQRSPYRDSAPISKWHGIGNILQPCPNPIDMRVDEAAGVTEIRPDRQRDDNGPTRATDTQCQSTCGWVTTYFDTGINS